MGPNNAGLGHHYCGEFYDCQHPQFSDSTWLMETLLNCVKQSGATVVDQKFHSFSPYGLSGVIIISESHFHIHSWPEHRYAAVDLFTCSAQLTFDAFKNSFSRAVQSEAAEVQYLLRGSKVTTALESLK